jgi:hypothetical protein
MDDHTYFILEKIERNIYRMSVVLEQLWLHVAELPINRSSESRRRIRVSSLSSIASCASERRSSKPTQVSSSTSNLGTRSPSCTFVIPEKAMTTHLDELIAALHEEIREERSRLKHRDFHTSKVEERESGNLRRLEQRVKVLAG